MLDQVYMSPVVPGPVQTLLHGSAAEVEVEGCNSELMSEIFHLFWRS